MDNKNNNILRYSDHDDILRRLKFPLVGMTLLANDLEKRHLKIKDYSYASKLELHFAEIKKITIGESCNLIIDLRDNPYIETLIIKDSFVGSVNLSRSSIRKIVVGSNCRCDFTIADSLNCFAFTAEDVYSGRLNIANSCFHKLRVGYYCYADIRLHDNWGKKEIFIGDSFRGNLEIEAVKTPVVNIGNDCKGKIKISSENEREGAEKVRIKNDFSGELDLSYDRNTARVEIGCYASGKFNMLNAGNLKVLKFDEAFSGIADLTESSVEYVRAGRGCRGQIVVLNCPNLTLLKLPVNKHGTITAERDPLKVEIDSDHIYYHFLDRELPGEYFTPFYVTIFRGMKNYFHRRP